MEIHLQRNISKNYKKEVRKKQTQMPLDMNKKWKNATKCMYNDRI